MATLINDMRHIMRVMIPYMSLFLFMFSVTLQYPIAQFMIADKGCTTYLPREVCKDLKNNREDERKLQMFTEDYISSLHTLGTITSVVMTMFLGAYSDRKGRKGVLLIPCIGVAVFAIAMFLQGQYLYISGFLLYGSTLAMGITGGMSAFVITMTCYLTDKTSPERRAITLASAVASIGFGSVLGGLATKMVASIVGTYNIHMVVLACQVIAMLLIILFLDESEEAQPPAQPISNKSGGKPSFIKGIWECMMSGPRVMIADDHEGRRRKHLIILSVITMLTMACSVVDTHLFTLRVQDPPFKWTPVTVDSFNSAKTFMTLVGTILVTRIYFHFTSSSHSRAELILVLITEGTILFNVLALGFAPFLLRFVPFVSALSGPNLPATRAYLSNIVKPSEIGSLLGFINLLNTIAAPIGSSAIITIYAICASFAPWIVFLFIAIVKISTMWLLWLLTRDVGSGGKKGL